ncbi:MAG: hypothetical protein M3R02_24110 [Chloroflexota bacterium]|nr:hypothetical protein [Chloroflexota bacterium]
MNQTQTRVAVQRAEDLLRLADQGERNGVRILVEPISGQHFATSATSPILYQVSAAGCSCRGYQTWQRCQHFGLFLSEMGWIPDVADTVVDERPAPCRCGGAGYVKISTGDRLNDWTATPCSCTRAAA